MMNPELKARWIAALRSGDYKQGTEALYSPEMDAYCCLGVLAELLPAGVYKKNLGRFGTPCLSGELGLYPNPDDEDSEDMIIKLVDILHSEENKLMDMNDGSNNYPKLSFVEIAVYIEKHL